MILDTSALLAILLREPEAAQFAASIEHCSDGGANVGGQLF